MATKTKVSLVKTDELSDAHREEMWAVYHKYYNYSKESFMARISSNNHFSIYTYENTLVGFTGLRISRANIAGQQQLLIYFGQTIIEHAFRGKSLIPVTGAKLCLKYFRELLFGKVYFWADALSYKAYLVFAKTLNEYYPSRLSQPPAAICQLVDHIGQKHYADAYCQESGTVKKTMRLVNDLSVNIYPSDLKDPDVRFYLDANPECVNGHGLLTIAPASRQNVGILAMRYLKKLWPGNKLNKQKKLSKSDAIIA